MNLVSAICRQCKNEFERRKDRPNAFCSHSCAARFNYQPRTKSFAKCHPDRLLTAHGLCKQCYYKEYNNKPEYQLKYRLTAKKSAMKRQFGITYEQWVKMYELQEGRCAICKLELAESNEQNAKISTCVDHDHSTGRVRGLVCSICNTGRVGRNTVDTAKDVLAYLESEFDARKL